MKIRTIFKISLASYVALVILAAVILGVVGASELTLACNTARVSDEMYAYWQAQNRYRYVSRHAAPNSGAADTPLFWRTPAKDGTDRTHEQAVEDLTREYVEYVAAASYLFDLSGYTLTDTERAAVETYIEEKVHYAFGDDRSAFNDAASKYGFDLTAMRNAELMVKKMQVLRENTYANEVQQDAYYKEKYIRIKLAYVKCDDPSYADKCNMIRLAIAETCTAEMLADGTDEFSRVVIDAAYNADATMRDNPKGYYLSKSSQFTNDTNTTLPAVIDAAFALASVGSSTEVTVTVTLDSGATEERTYFLRRYDPASLAYTEDENKLFFTDFVSLATDHYFFRWCDTAREECVWKEEHIPKWVPGGSGSDLFKFF